MAITFSPKIGDTAYEVFRGEYDVPNLEITGTILDIGANVGAFAFWARQKWPFARIVCYEPSLGTFKHLENTLKGEPDIELHNAAVTSSGQTRLYHGKHNTTEDTLFPNAQSNLEEFEDVAVVHPADLPECEFLKIDTEGAELEILESYRHMPCGIALEWHSHEHRIAIVELLKSRGYTVQQFPNVVINAVKRVNIGIIKAWK